jgi:cytochrome c biogenesis protein CcmG/thiol:disulfide interchange protein DsbE
MAQEISGPIGDDALAGEVTTAPQGSPPVDGIIRTRIIPIIALLFVVGLVGLLAYSLFAPDNVRLGANGRINDSGALIMENGRSAPDFTLTMFDGSTFHLADQRGKIVVVNFWASWCPPCRDEMPLLTTAAGQLDSDVVLVGVNVWDQKDDAQSFADYYQVNYPIAEDGGSMAVDFGVTGVPETFVIDGNGKIIARLPGPITSVQQLRDMIAEAR